MRLFVAEKPSVAKAIAAELGGPATRGDGFLTCGNVGVTWCFGHILEMAKPEQYDPELSHWRAQDLPIIPSAWKLIPRREAKKQLAIIGKLLKEASEVVHAGDPDREGQLLVDEVLEHFRYKRTVLRFWVSAQDSVSIRRGLAALKDNRTFRGLRDAALARSRADWLIGINLSRAYTLRTRRAGADALVTIGRVQTPTLALVVERDRAIEVFRPIPHYTLWIELEHANGRFRAKWQAPKDHPGLDSDGRLLDPAIADRIARAVSRKVGALADFHQERKSEGQPKAYTLARLTLEASRRFGYTAEDILKACQALYETHKLASYPRTDCEFLPESQFTDAPRILAALRQVNPGLADTIAAADPRIRSKTWNDAKVTAHHGIIPTMHAGDASALSEIEGNIYEMIVRTYLAQFYPPHEYLHTLVTAEIERERFCATGKVVIRNGWRDLFSAEPADEVADKDDPAQPLPSMQKGDQVRCVDAERKDLKTKPPPRFTEGTLQAAMEHIHKYVADPKERRILKDGDGIGTPATRATIIGDLKRRGFLRLSGRDLISTELGRKLVDVVPREVKSPSLTALYEGELKCIEQSKKRIEDFLKTQEVFVTTQVAAANEGANVDAQASQSHNLKCPQCGHDTLRRIARKDGSGHFWGCSRYRDGCKAAYQDRDGAPALEVAAPRPCPQCGKGQLRRIARKDGSGHFWGCSGYRDGCKATYPDKEGTPVIEASPATIATYPCPQCGKGQLRRIARKDGSGHFWGCSGYRDGCKAAYPDKNGVPKLTEAKQQPLAAPSAPPPAALPASN